MVALAKERTMKITKIKEHVGAEVTGIDLRKPIDDETFHRLYNALVDNVVMVIRDQDFTPAEYQAAVGLFGDLMEDQNRLYLVPGFPMISVLSNRQKDSQGKTAKIAKNSNWHTDHTNQEFPPKFTVLYAVELPDRGGGTSVCNMNAAFEALPDDLKKRLSPMMTSSTLISSTRLETGNPDIVREHLELKTPPMVHPLVRTHPERGTKALWFHKGKIENIHGMSPEETQDFLADLLEKTLLPEFIYVHEWKLGDMLIVDNRSAMHKAGFDYDHSQHRLLYRMLVRGDRPY
ncbi:MAG: TauD/TfdA family dioxygenase [Rhodospirillales bacterium]